MEFLLRGGNHILNGRTYRDGDKIKTHLALDKIFARTGKFTRINHSPMGAEVTQNPSAPVSTNVTSLVGPNLSDLGLKVEQKGAWYYVVEEATGKVLNEKALRHDQIEGFVKQFMEN